MLEYFSNEANLFSASPKAKEYIKNLVDNQHTALNALDEKDEDTNSESYVFEFANGKILIEPDHITVCRIRSLVGKNKYDSGHIIPISDISSIEVMETRFVGNGYIKVHLKGTDTKHGSVFDKDTITIIPGENNSALEVKQIVNTAVLNYQKNSLPTATPAAPTDTGNLSKIKVAKELFADGIITAEQMAMAIDKYTQ